MNLTDIAHSRFNMIEQQIRPWEVLDGEVLSLLTVVKRENFAPLAHKALAFVDMEIPLKDGNQTGQVMLAPRVEARFLQDADVKRRPFAEASDGAVGLETLLAAALRLTHGVEELSLTTVLKAMTVNPANLLGLPAGRLAKAAPADLILIDLGEPWVVNKEHLSSRSKNSPFDGAKFQGRVKRTVVAGQTVFPFEKAP
jgi:hypothetical protein